MKASASSSSVHFEGSWQSDEIELVDAAVAQAEAGDLPEIPSAMGAPWVATRQDVGRTTVYMACRWMGDSAIVARSASDLASRIRGFAEATDPASRTARPEADSLFLLVYESRAADTTRAADLQSILDEARCHNAEVGITGLLLYAHRQFIQVLEGPEAAVRELYASIRDDPRHTDVTTLLTTTVAERSFPGWQMGFETPDMISAADDDTSQYLQSGDLPPTATPIADVLDALRRFRMRVAESEG